MNSKITFQIELANAQVEALLELYEYWHLEYNPETPHDALLFEHMLEMKFRLHVMLLKRVKKSSLTFTSTELIAFCQTWESVKIIHPLSEVIVNHISSLVHKQSLAPTRQSIKTKIKSLPKPRRRAIVSR